MSIEISARGYERGDMIGQTLDNIRKERTNHKGFPRRGLRGWRGNKNLKLLVMCKNATEEDMLA